MPATKRLIFVSYSQKDQTLADEVFTALRGIEEVELWIDDDQVEVGDDWLRRIDQGLAGSKLAVLLISPNFMASRFIIEHERTRLLERREREGLRLVPIWLRPTRLPEWLKWVQVWPQRDRTLTELVGPGERDRALKKIVEAVVGFLGSESVTAPTATTSTEEAAGMEDPRCTQLLADTLLADVPGELQAVLAERLVSGVRKLTSLTGDTVFDAVRFFIEFHLLRTDDATAPAELEASLAPGNAGADARLLVARLRAKDLTNPPVQVDSRFFGRTNDHAELWKAYFDAVVAAGASTDNAVRSLVPVRVMLGFLAPQFLLSGLLSRLNDDWRPVLSAYQATIQQRAGAFGSLQASQWNCWLMWGPSIPVCQCREWRGLFALQYGYGDENNSIPVVELDVDDRGVPKTLGPIVSTLRAEGRHAKFAMLGGRLRWGPSFLRAQPVGPDGAEAIIADEQDVEMYAAAPAQASLYHGGENSDGLVLQLEQLEKSTPESRMYFSAYFWLMFLVALPADEGGADPAQARPGPRLLGGKGYPEWTYDVAERRRRLGDVRLWEDLVPVFVHANISDPGALQFQRRMLVESAIQLLRQVWERRAELFKAEDVAAGIRFYLVCASDYSGCDGEVRYPSDTPLLKALRDRLDADADPAFAASVMVPAAPQDRRRPWQFLGYFSSCHLPDLVAEYNDRVAAQLKRPG
jgi:hypothetical protein